MMNHKHYLRQFIIITTLTITGLCLLNYAIDSYGLYNTPTIDNINKRKPAADTRSRHIKPFQATRVAPRTLILGNSRPEMGLSPHHVCWQEHEKPVFNMALPGSSLYLQARYAQHALQESPITQILLGIDFFDALMGAAKQQTLWPPRAKEFEERLSVNIDYSNNTNYKFEQSIFILKTLFSLDSLKDSIYTLTNQANLSTTHKTPLGFNPAQDYYRHIIKNEGADILFTQKNRDITNRLKRKKWSIINKDNDSAYFQSLKLILELSKNNNISLAVFINPYHKDYLKAIKETGNQTLFIHWKEKSKSLVTLYENATFYDFSDFTPFNNEDSPSRGSRKELEWFWEPAHYKKELGDVILSKMLQNQCFTNNP